MPNIKQSSSHGLTQLDSVYFVCLVVGLVWSELWFFETGAHSPDWVGTHYIAQASLKFKILLPQPPAC
jgi:hypothetical protein